MQAIFLLSLLFHFQIICRVKISRAGWAKTRGIACSPFTPVIREVDGEPRIYARSGGDAFAY